MSGRRNIGLVVGGVLSIGVICLLFSVGQLFSRKTRPSQWPEGDVLCFEGGGCIHAPKGQPRMNDPPWARKTMDNNPISEGARANRRSYPEWAGRRIFPCQCSTVGPTGLAATFVVPTRSPRTARPASQRRALEKTSPPRIRALPLQPHWLPWEGTRMSKNEAAGGDAHYWPAAVVSRRRTTSYGRRSVSGRIEVVAFGRIEVVGNRDGVRRDVRKVAPAGRSRGRPN